MTLTINFTQLASVHQWVYINEHSIWIGIGISISTCRILNFVLGIESIGKSGIGPPLVHTYVIQLM